MPQLKSKDREIISQHVNDLTDHFQSALKLMGISAHVKSITFCDAEECPDTCTLVPDPVIPGKFDCEC